MIRTMIPLAWLLLAWLLPACQKSAPEYPEPAEVEGVAAPVAPTAAAAPETGALTIRASVAGARLTLLSPEGDELVAGAPLEMASAVVGEWTVKAAADGREDAEGRVTVEAEETATLELDLQPAGGLAVSGGVEGARVTLYGDGLVSSSAVPAKFAVLPGRYRVRVAVEQGPAYERVVTVGSRVREVVLPDAPAEARDSIVIAGERHLLDAGVKAVVFDDPEGLSWTQCQKRIPMVRPREGSPRDRAALGRAIQYVVLHADLTETTLDNFEAGCKRQLGSHFGIDWDGTIYQFADVRDRVPHVANYNDPAIGIDLNNLLPNVSQQPERGERAEALMAARGTTRPKIAGRIQFGRQETYGFTDAQYDALLALLRVLVAEYPHLNHVPLKTEDGSVVMHALSEEEAARFAGIVTHWHLSDSRWDPGPAFEWKRLCDALGCCEPSLDSRSQGIVIAGERVPLTGDIRVVTFADDPTLRIDHGTRPRTRGSDGGAVQSVGQLRDRVSLVMLHSDYTSDARKTHSMLVGRKVATHFNVNWDGTVYQYVDVLDAAQHARGVEDVSVGIDLNNRMPNFSDERSVASAREDMRERGYSRPEHRGRINGAEHHTFGYTEAQYASLSALVTALRANLPGIEMAAPVTEDGEVLTTVMEGSCASFAGIVAHWHCAEERWDPGPGFDWNRLLKPAAP